MAFDVFLQFRRTELDRSLAWCHLNLAWNKPRNINTSENNVRKRAQNWVFWISRSLRYISDFFGPETCHWWQFSRSFFFFFHFFSVLPRPTTLSVITEVSLLPCWQMFLIIWGIMLSACLYTRGGSTCNQASTFPQKVSPHFTCLHLRQGRKLIWRC